MRNDTRLNQPDMGYYSLSYVVAIALSAVCWALVFKRYRNPFGWYFFLFTIFVSSWFFFYFLFFSGIEDEALLLFLSRLNFWIGIGVTWTLWFFVRNFSTEPAKIVNAPTVRAAMAYVPLLAVYSLTPAIVGSLEFSSSEGVYREVFGPLFPIHPILHLTAVTWLVWDAVKQVGKQKGLDLVRLKRLLFAAGSFIGLCLILQLVLPMFGIWILEKEIVFFYLAFTVYAFHALRRYYFHSWAFAGKYAIAGASAIVGIGTSVIYERLYSALAHRSAVVDYWANPDENSLSKIIVALIGYAITSNFLRSRLFWNPKIAALQEEISVLEREITGIVNQFDLNAILKSKGAKIFRTWLCYVALSKDESRPRLDAFFQSNTKVSEFMDDEVFMADKPEAENAKKDFPAKAFLAFPLHGDGKMDGYLFLWKKTLSDAYSSEEAAELRKFALFLELQLKNMETYAQLQDVSINLDRKVDEKTIEYNDLINKQKEFISVISHEIKAPITNAVFQSDGLLDDLETWLPKERLKKELSTLNAQLVRAGELLTKLFSVQYYETRSVTLFKEKILVDQLLASELEIYAKMRQEIRFVDRVSRDLWFIELDRLQFQQVVSNLLQNASKHSKRKNPTIVLGAVRTETGLEISVEDDGEGFESSDTEKLFERYTTGAGGSASLGMGLYLCRIIVEMHGGSIRAWKSEEFWGAKFTFTIPTA